MQPIKINTIVEPTCELFCEALPLSIGILHNRLEVNDVLIQIKRAKLKGYYIMFRGNKILISEHGRLSKKPKGFYDLQAEQLRELI